MGGSKTFDTLQTEIFTLSGKTVGFNQLFECILKYTGFSFFFLFSFFFFFIGFIKTCLYSIYVYYSLPYITIIPSFLYSKMHNCCWPDKTTVNKRQLKQTIGYFTKSHIACQEENHLLAMISTPNISRRQSKLGQKLNQLLLSILLLLLLVKLLLLFSFYSGLAPKGMHSSALIRRDKPCHCTPRSTQAPALPQNLFTIFTDYL